MIPQLLFLLGSLLIGVFTNAIVLYNVVIVLLDAAGVGFLRLLRRALRWLAWPCPAAIRHKRRVWQLLRRMDQADSYADWVAAARAVDDAEGATAWREAMASEECDERLVDETRAQLRRARKAGDIHTLMFHLRSLMSRHFGGIDNPQLYKRSFTGTKKTVERYLTEVCACIDAVAAAPPSLVPSAAKRDFIETCRLSIGRTALALSGGGSLAMAHMGVVRVLISAGLLPRVISGTSGGVRSVMLDAACKVLRCYYVPRGPPLSRVADLPLAATSRCPAHPPVCLFVCLHVCRIDLQSIIAAMMALYTDEELMREYLRPDIVSR